MPYLGGNGQGELCWAKQQMQFRSASIMVTVLETPAKVGLLRSKGELQSASFEAMDPDFRQHALGMGNGQTRNVFLPAEKNEPLNRHRCLVSFAEKFSSARPIGETLI